MHIACASQTEALFLSVLKSLFTMCSLIRIVVWPQVEKSETSLLNKNIAIHFLMQLLKVCIRHLVLTTCFSSSAQCLCSVALCFILYCVLFCSVLFISFLHRCLSFHSGMRMRLSKCLNSLSFSLLSFSPFRF